MYLIRFDAPVMFCVFGILALYAGISGINCNMNMSAVQALEVYGSNGVKYIKFHLQIHFLFASLCLYVCMYTLRVCLPPWTQGVNWACNRTFKSCPELS